MFILICLILAKIIINFFGLPFPFRSYFSGNSLLCYLSVELSWSKNALAGIEVWIMIRNGQIKANSDMAPWE